MRGNVRPFRPKAADSLEWGPRLIAAAVYLGLGYLLRFPSENHLTLLFILGIIYWIVVQQKRFPVPYLLRYNLLQALILYFWLILAFLLLGAFLNFLLVTAHLVQLGAFVDPLVAGVFPFTGLIIMAVMLGFGVVLAVMTLMGKTPVLPGITDNVRRWV